MMMRTRILSLALSVIFFPGCSSPGPSTPNPDDALTPLEAWKSCRWVYPDNRALECSQNLAGAASASIPSGWVCIDAVSDANRSLELVSDSMGRYGIFYQLTGSGKFYGRGYLTASTMTQKIIFGGSSSGFAEFPQTAGNQGRWSVTVWEFLAEGQPVALWTNNLSMHVTEFEDDLWFLWVFVDGRESFLFQKMDQLDFEGVLTWLPGNFSLQGSDFHLNATAQRKISSISEFAYPTTTVVNRSCDLATGGSRSAPA